MFKKYLILLALSVACSKGGDDRLREIAAIESETAAQSQNAVEVATLNKKSTEMEQDLDRRHQFFQKVKGKYEGDFKTDLGNFRVRILLVPSLNPMRRDRFRLLEEVAYDLNNLHFNAQIQQWVDGDPSSAVGCKVEGIKPDIANGIISIVSASCPNVYFLALSDESISQDSPVSDYYRQLIDQGQSARLAVNVLNSEASPIQELAGYIQLTNVASSYHFRAKKVEK